MTALPPGVPRDAECLDLWQFARVDREPSKLIPHPDVHQLAPMLCCPRCQRERPLPKCEMTINCAGCGLSMNAGPSYLYIWENEPETAA